MIHAHGYWLEAMGANTHVCDNELCAEIINTFKVDTAIDVGCGDGSYTRKLINAGIDCFGFDGNPNTFEMSGGLCRVLDFSYPLNIVTKYDLVLCLEVGEHIPEEFEQTFIDNLCNLSKRWVCLSWGVPGQPGYGHVNRKTNEYIIGEMKKRGFKFDPELSERLRKHSTLEWFQNTIMVYDSSIK